MCSYCAIYSYLSTNTCHWHIFPATSNWVFTNGKKYGIKENLTCKTRFSIPYLCICLFALKIYRIQVNTVKLIIRPFVYIIPHYHILDECKHLGCVSANKCHLMCARKQIKCNSLDIKVCKVLPYNCHKSILQNILI